ncbi:crotonobetainyl-CoA:carnitine CoA-transferase CaiB-like acyl-CoA transferase [Saccharothrix tamanrassetensis]|uniref:Crotonobetainyl-CoA:carnitine CoA-transferase CaiB-like acyl-CoA transferase n=1 Tax=Saccharothrix tamanrassetensis TaxID=1051531 RepID=A0A841CHS0_9PSEU|nr:CoA transferase [Saccharothrix tamanrassetensis]MBB5958082.1 crotonobetainyl-CoA:carnitine CoA-transferase CaiB-like acyl-CoA transferase [Saccharothrix tamanrassetensis]
MTHGDDSATAQAWAALGGPAGMSGEVAYEPAGGVLAARLPVRELARAAVGVCSLAAAELLAARNGAPLPAVRVHEGAVATAFVSERHLRIDGRAPVTFAPLSRFWRAADGWVRTHANYPHHRARLLDALGVPDTGDDETLVERLAAEVAARPAEAVQEDVYAAGGLAVAVRAATGERHPLVETRPAGSGTRVLPPAGLPAEGVRVLDLTRVIAGPVATRTLALLGADVLRVDSPALPESGDALADTGPGKRSTLLELSDDGDRQVFEELLGRADVVVTGYRPGALDRYRLAPDDLLERHPGLVVAQLCAWGWTGPWAGRRGFDSLVQAGSGIAVVEGDGDRPGVLPAQALDHGTGYLLAAGVLRALTGRLRTGGGRHLRLSLAGTASWLLHDLRPTAPDGGPYDPQPWVTEVGSPYGIVRHAVPPVQYEGAPTGWSRPASRWGDDRPEWTVR